MLNKTHFRSLCVYGIFLSRSVGQRANVVAKREYYSCVNLHKFDYYNMRLHVNLNIISSD